MFACRCLSFCCSIGLISSAAVAAEIPKPPRPDPAKPVNYIAWINQTMGAGLKENAAAIYRDAYAEFVPFEGDLGEVLDGPWSDNPKVSEWLATNRGAMKLFRQAAAMQECFFPLEEENPTGDPRRDHILAFLLMPDFKTHRPLCRALIAEGYQSWQKGDRKTLIANAVNVIRSGQHLDNTPITMQRLVGTACIALGCQAILKALSLSDDPDKLADEVLVQLRQVSPARVPLSRVLVSERLAAWDFCQRLLVPGKQPGAWSLYQPMVGGEPSAEQKSILGEQWAQNFKDLKKLPAIGFDATVREINARFDEMEQWMGRPYDEAAGEPDRIARRIKESSNPFVRMFVSEVTRTRITDDCSVASLRATYLVAHILARHGATDGYPASLDELKTPHLEQIRTDPLSGRDFAFKRQAQSFMLYTVSRNLKDDGGQHDESWKTGDFVFWPVQQKPPPKAGG